MFALLNALTALQVLDRGSPEPADVDEPPSPPHPAEAPPEDGTDWASALPQDVKARVLVAFLAPDDVARVACASRAWRAAAVGVWVEKYATLRGYAPALPPPPPRHAPPAAQLAALAAAQDAAHIVAGSACGITHWHLPYWSRSGDEVPHAALGALSGPDAAAVCRSVCWFDVRATLMLPPGAWLVRWRVRTLVGAPWPSEVFHMATAAGGADDGRVVVTPVPGALAARRAVPRGATWALQWVDGSRGGAGGSGDEPTPPAPQRSVDARWAAGQESNRSSAWLHLPAAVVHVRPAHAGDAAAVDAVAVSAALFKHTDYWVQGLVVDCVQAVPLNAPRAVFGPLPRSLATPPPGFDALPAERFSRLAVAAVPRERWQAPHWATKRLL